MIRFNKPPQLQSSMEYIKSVMETGKTSGDGEYTKKCNEWIEKNTGTHKAYLTTSCTHSLEIGAIIAKIEPGDEVIMPSYTFVATANAFAMRGAKVVFVDVRPDTMNIDEKLVEAAVTERTKAIAPIDYAGVAAEMDEINAIAQKYNLTVVEDAAQGAMSTYKGRALGTLGDVGCFSYHETKNYSMGEGGAVLLKNEDFADTAERLRENGTNRRRYIRGELDKYTWDILGSSYLPSEINAAYLLGQLEIAEKINDNRLKTWDYYYENFKPLADKGIITLPTIPEHCTHNAHMFYIKTPDVDTRTEFVAYMKKNDIVVMSHYVPLHDCPAGKVFSRFHGEDKYTTAESEKLVRLPLYYEIPKGDVDTVIEKVNAFFK